VKNFDSDERPTTGEVLGAAILALVSILCWWLFSILSMPL